MSEDDEPITHEEIEEISDDEDWEHLKTKEHLDAMSSEKLLVHIESDDECIVYKQYPLSGVLIYAISLLTIGLVPIVLFIAFVVESNIVKRTELLVIGLAAFSAVWMCLLSYAFLESKLYRTVLSDRGIGVRGPYGNTAIEWEHLEYIDVWRKGDRTEKIEFTGNRRNFWVENSLFEKRFSIDVITRYLPDLTLWTEIKKKQWKKGISRYHRPSTDERF